MSFIVCQFLILNFDFLFEYGASLARFQLLEEVVALIVHEDECREVLHFDLPDSLHTQFGVLHALDGLDIVLRQDSSRTTDRTEVETTVLLTSIRHIDGAVALGEHDHRAAVILEDRSGELPGIHPRGRQRQRFL